MSVLGGIAIGLFLLVATPAMAIVVNPGFESGLAGWTSAGASQFTRGTTAAPISEGASAARIFNRNTGTVNPGDFGEIRQSVDMTNILSITFDLAAQYNGSGNAWDPARFIASATIDGVDAVTFSSTNTFLGVVLDVSGLVGIHDLGFRLTSLATTIGTGTTGPGAVTHQIRVDNIRTDEVTVSIPEPDALALFGLGLAGLGFARRRKAA